MELDRVSRKFALKNATEHDGEADPGSVIGQVINETGEDPGEVQKVVPGIVEDVNQLSRDEQRQEMEEFEYIEEEHEHDPLPDLKNAEEGEVVLRFAPNPNGPPHLGHARGMIINGALSDKYDGKLILRYDDTDPVKKRPMEEAYQMYQEDFEWLGYEPDEVRYSSKNFDKYIEYAEELIEMDKAYVCECSKEEGRNYREEGEPCPHRDRRKDESLDLWSRMVDGEIDEGNATLKIKTDIQHKNPAARDFVAFRIIEEPQHPITGNGYSVWPMLDFAGAIEDYLMGTTHIVRGKDLRDSTTRQKFIYDYLDWKYPEVRYWGTVEVSGFNAPLSTSSIAEMVNDGELEGWSDPRCGTLKALRKRGFRPEAIKEFFLEMGVSEKDSDASVETLEAKNRQLVESSDRRFFVRDPVELDLKGLPDEIKAELPLHPDHPGRGTRQIKLERKAEKAKITIEKEDLKDGFLRFKGLCNAELDGKEAFYREGDHSKAIERDAPIIHWLPSSSPTEELHMPDGEVILGKIEDFEAKKGDLVQFERLGFARKTDGGFYFTHE